MHKRFDWTFQFTVEELRKASETKLQFHSERLTYWEGEKAKVLDGIKDHGLDVRDIGVTGGYRTEVRIDMTEQRRLDEAVSKAEEHRGKRDQYARWIAIFKRESGGRALDLSEDDVDFFFGTLEDPSEQNS